MSFPSQLPLIPLGPASPTLRELAQAAGPTVEARVLGQLPNGATQVQIGRQVLSLQLPEMAPVGTTLVLALQQSEGQVQVALVATRPPPATPANAPTPTGVPANPAATSIELSPAALLAGSTSSATGSSALPPATAAQAQAASQVSTAPTQAPVGASVQPGRPAVPAGGVNHTVSVPQAGSAAYQPASSVPIPAQGPVLVPGAGTVQPPMAAAHPVAAPVIAAAATTVATGSPRPTVPYVAAVAPAAPVAPVSTPSGAQAQTVAQALGGNAVGQHASQPNMSPPAAAAQTVVPGQAPPQSPSAALTQMVQQALPRQDSIVGLTTALANVVGRVAMPDAVVKAAQKVLGQRIALDSGSLDGAALRNAVRSSGIFQEAMLATGQARVAGGDTKSALLGLQRQLGAWLGDQVAVEQLSSVPPPLKGMPPRARLADQPAPDLPDDPELAGKAILERTEAALSRLRLHQNASLPEPLAQRNEAQWSLDLPVTVAGHQALLQMQIHRDADGDATRPDDRGWQVRFAINLSEAGEVGAQISLRGQTAGVLLWADDPGTATVLAEGVTALRDQLAAAGLTPGALVVRTGAPMLPPAAPAPAVAGNLVDAVR